MRRYTPDARYRRDRAVPIEPVRVVVPVRLLARPFQCFYCPKRFRTLADLEAHRDECGPETTRR